MALTVVSIACTRADDACFCTSVGGGPDDPQGSDVLMHPLADGGFVAHALTDKGRSLLALAGPPFWFHERNRAANSDGADANQPSS